MAKNDFDIDFDFEKEYGFNPQAILDSEYTDEDLDLSEFTEDDADARYGRKSDDFDDFDLDGLDLDEDAGEDVREDYGYAEESGDDLQGLDFEDDEYPDDADLTARQCGLEQICRIGTAFCRTGSHQHVKLIDEENGNPLLCLTERKRGFQPLLKFPAVFCTGNH